MPENAMHVAQVIDEKKEDAKLMIIFKRLTVTSQLAKLSNMLFLIIYLVYSKAHIFQKNTTTKQLKKWT